MGKLLRERADMERGLNRCGFLGIAMMSLHHRLLIAGTIMHPVLRNHLQSVVTTVILPLQLQEEMVAGINGLTSCC